MNFSLIATDAMELNSQQNANWTGPDFFYKTLFKLYQDVKQMREIYIYIGSFITVLGVVLNLLCICIFYRSKIFKNSSFPYYVYIISVTDTINIFLRFVVPQLIEKIIRYNLQTHYNVSADQVDQEKYDKYTNKITSEYHCSIFFYVYNSFTLISVWLMVAVSLERLVVVKFTLQTKYMIKLRAFLILTTIFVCVFVFNMFDLAPGLYLKPQWYANLTLLCEREDIEVRSINPSLIYKSIGSLTFNSDHFALIRLLLQSIVPFLFVLIFNSLIIHNFKKIKLAARGRGKSNSTVSVNSLSGNGSAMQSRSNRSLRTKRLKQSSQNKFQLQIPQRSPDFSISSRSPSPNMSAPQTPITPTSLVSALNLVPSKNSYLMPPEHNNGTMTPTSTNSSANLSDATTTNLTSSTCVNQNNQSSDKLSIMISSVLPNKKHVGTTTTNSARVSFKRRVNKLKLNRETDIMLIVLSFSILLSQLPFTIASYLIYYRNIFKDMYDDLKSIYLNARSPMLLYIIRLLEMCYFSLNFVFYITLSPSLRKELRKNLPKQIQFWKETVTKCFSFMSRSDKKDDNCTNKKEKPNLYGEYLTKIRSLSPVQRPNYLNTRPKRFRKKFSNAESESTSNKITIIIDNMYDDDEEIKVDRMMHIGNEKFADTEAKVLDRSKRLFNLSSPSCLNSLNSNKQVIGPNVDKKKLEKVAYL